ncbi:Hypothetical predicted protein, partial [Scomber scombrus]
PEPPSTMSDPGSAKYRGYALVCSTLRITLNGAEKEFKSPEETSAFIRSLNM